ncbi:hypothetical protein AKUG0410_14410 [Apilactobacillus kunkeei]|nr:hypothetical protein AKUG0412_14410 [Apilactobacillus kunkeei]CAI2696899.1 hypothetical protein AKUG0410_14410 [Apilactobacillus kunkeei]
MVLEDTLTTKFTLKLIPTAFRFHIKHNDHSPFKDTDVKRLEAIKGVKSVQKAYASTGIQMKSVTKPLNLHT